MNVPNNLFIVHKCVFQHNKLPRYLMPAWNRYYAKQTSFPDYFQNPIFRKEEQASLLDSSELSKLATVPVKPPAAYETCSVYHDPLVNKHRYIDGIQLWVCTKQSNRQIIQRFQNKVLRGIVNAPWYYKNDYLHRDLKVELVDKVIQKYAEAHDRRLQHHVNPEAVKLLDFTDIVRRLKRTKPFELV